MATSAPMTTRFAERKRVIRDDDDEDAGGKQQQQQYQRKEYNFSETADSILAKYANEPASLELHIHHTHFRFGNQEGVLPKNSPLIKMFFEFIAKQAIPPAATEVFRDSGIRFYEGCIIIKIIDHRNVPVSKETQAQMRVATQPNQHPPQSPHTQTQTQTPQTPQTPSQSESKEEPKQEVEPLSYRAIMQPTPMSLWHDLLYTTDTSHGRFSNQLALSMEAEILTLTVRNVDLRVDCPPAVPQEFVRKKPKTGLTTQEAAKLHNYRQAGPKKLRGLHEDLSHHGTEYEELMLIMDERQESGSSSNGQFLRLSFVEQLRKKREIIRLASLQQQQQQQRQGQPGGTGTTQNAASAGRQTGQGTGQLSNADQQQQLLQMQMQNRPSPFASSMPVASQSPQTQMMSSSPVAKPAPRPKGRPPNNGNAAQMMATPSGDIAKGGPKVKKEVK